MEERRNYTCRAVCWLQSCVHRWLVDLYAVSAADVLYRMLCSRDVMNGEETIIVEEDGVITTKTHNGRPCV